MNLSKYFAKSVNFFDVTQNRNYIGVVLGKSYDSNHLVVEYIDYRGEEFLVEVEESNIIEIMELQPLTPNS